MYSTHTCMYVCITYGKVGIIIRLVVKYQYFNCQWSDGQERTSIIEGVSLKKERGAKVTDHFALVEPFDVSYVGQWTAEIKREIDI